jgi:tetrahydromethanopterin S-methyltransferase subunit C
VTPLERPVPPSGEEIHIPGPSLQPIVLTLGLTMTLVGVTVSTVLVVAGLVLTVVTIVVWVRDARREFAELPLEHEHH